MWLPSINDGRLNVVPASTRLVCFIPLQFNPNGVACSHSEVHHAVALCGGGIIDCENPVKPQKRIGAIPRNQTKLVSSRAS